MFARLARRAARTTAPAVADPAAARAAPESRPDSGPAVHATEAAARERLRAFALAASDMLLETLPDGRIVFAAGRGLAGITRPEALVGRDIVSLVAPSDAASFAMALSLATRDGRMAPVMLRFADGTPATVSAMVVPGPPARLCFTIGPVPLAPPSPPRAEAARATAALAGRAAGRIREGAGGRLGLVEITGWPALRAQLPPEAMAHLRGALGDALAEIAGGAPPDELAEGRYGVVAPGGPGLALAPALAQVTERVERFLARRLPDGAAISALELSLDPGPLPPSTAARLLRYAIGRFTEGGTAAAAAIGARGGLAGILAQAEARSHAMQAALSGHRFRLAYQPVVALADREVHHYEALLRPIATPGLLVDGIQEFVTFAEAVGLSDVLDLAVLEEALAGLRESATAAVAVNVSGLSLQSEPFRDRMFAALEAAAPAIAARASGLRLMVELTETSEIEDMHAAAAALSRLRAMGIAVCLDDFGMGAAAFRYLQQFHVDYVKIDGSFVQAAMAGGRERALVGSMVALATAAGARTVAEMIETEDQARLMAELGVTQGQGWLFGRPGALPGALPGARR